MLVGVFFYALLRGAKGLDRLEDWIEQLLASGYDPFTPPAKAFGGRNSSTRSGVVCTLVDNEILKPLIEI